MPSLPLVERAEQELGLPVLSGATAGAFCLLRALGLPTEIPGARVVAGGPVRRTGVRVARRYRRRP
jgi:maleate isomerase